MPRTCPHAHPAHAWSCTAVGMATSSDPISPGECHHTSHTHPRRSPNLEAKQRTLTHMFSHAAALEKVDAHACTHACAHAYTHVFTHPSRRCRHASIQGRPQASARTLPCARLCAFAAIAARDRRMYGLPAVHGLSQGHVGFFFSGARRRRARTDPRVV